MLPPREPIPVAQYSPSFAGGMDGTINPSVRPWPLRCSGFRKPLLTCPTAFSLSKILHCLVNLEIGSHLPFSASINDTGDHAMDLDVFEDEDERDDSSASGQTTDSALTSGTLTPITTIGSVASDGQGEPPIPIVSPIPQVSRTPRAARRRRVRHRSPIARGAGGRKKNPKMRRPKLDAYQNTLPFEFNLNLPPVPAPGLEIPRYAGLINENDFNLVFYSYISGLAGPKVYKAAVSLELARQVRQCLKKPWDCRIGTTQFRNWVRRRFVLEEDPTGDHQDGMQGDRLLFKCRYSNMIVALREDFYRLLTDAHAQTGHGGRDRVMEWLKTRNIGWLSKDLVGKFTNCCPTCQPEKASAFLTQQRAAVELSRSEWAL